MALVAGGLAGGAPARADGRMALEDVVRVVPQTDECVQAEALAIRIRRYLGRDDIAEGIEVELTLARPVAFVLRRPGEPPATRRFDVLPASCEARLDALSLAIAMAIDPGMLARLGEERDGQASASESESESESTSGEPRVRVAIAAGVGAGYQLVPGWTADGTLAVELRFAERALLRVGGLVTSSREQALPPGAFVARLFAGRLDGCVRGQWGVVALSGCLGIAAGAVRAEGRGFGTNLQTTRPWVAANGGLRLELPSQGTLAAALTVEGVVPILRPALHAMDPGGAVVDSQSFPSVGLRLGLEALARLGGGG